MKKSLGLIVTGLALMYSCNQQPHQEISRMPKTITIYSSTDTVVYKPVLDEPAPEQKEPLLKRFKTYLHEQDSSRAADISNARRLIDENVFTYDTK